MYEDNLQTISITERMFCELFINGCAPYAGNAERCYRDAFHTDKNDPLNNHKAKLLLQEQRIKDYIQVLNVAASEEAENVKRYITANLKHIIEETSTMELVDRHGKKVSPAALRSVAVNASKALMEMYPIKEAQVSRVDINAGDEAKGLTFNVIVPESKQ